MNEPIEEVSIELLDIDVVNEEILIITAQKLFNEAGTNLLDRSNAINKICQMLYDLHDSVKADVYISELSKKHKIAKRVFQEKYRQLEKTNKEEEDQMGDSGIPPDVDAGFARKFGFFTHRGCYYFLTKEGAFKGSNFTIKPLFHVYSKTDNKRLVEITNHYGCTKIMDVPSKSFISVDQFQAAAFNEGNYIWFGTKVHFLKILENISEKFPVCNELKTLGWQREGFYAFSNGIYGESWQPVDEYGITTHKENKFFSPSFSKVYTNVREDDDEYENDRFFIYQKASVSFEQWSTLMHDVYGEKATIAIGYLIATVFRDFIYEKYKIFPHLFLFGEKQSGKSQLAWSLSNMFFDNLPAFNLNSGTQVGFFRRLSRVKNCICWFDEYTNDIEEKRFQSLKSAYDGMGHEKGKMSKDNRTEITKVNSASVISGQYLPTRDDNALFTRSILLSFQKLIYTKKQTQKYDRLKQLELEGLSSLIGEILTHRSIVDKQFGMMFSDIMESLKADLTKENRGFDERLVRNFCCILTPIKIIGTKLKVGFSYRKIYDLSKDMIADLSNQISSSESLSNFWAMVEYLFENNLISIGQDFKINSTHSLLVTKENGSRIKEEFDTPKMVLHVRFSKIHPMYMEAHRKQFGKNGVDLVSLMHYIKHHKSYLGYMDSFRFETKVSSCYCFDYEALNIGLDKLPIDFDSETNSVVPESNNIDKLPF